MKISLCLLFLLAAGGLHADTTIDPSHSFAYGANVGWLNWRGDVTNGAVVGEYVCSGYIWSGNVGWISLGSGAPENGIQYGNASASDFGVNLVGHSISGGVPRAQLRGFAYGANIGWINFESQGNPEVSLSTGELTGFAWSANCGWINLNSATSFVQTDTIRSGVDSDGDGIADAYEFLHTSPPGLALLNATGDVNGDGQSDLEEYLADTDPLDPDSNLRITAFDTDSGSFSLTWTSDAARRYRIESTVELSDPMWELTLDNIPPDGTTTTRDGAIAASAQRFYRVKAYRPLSP